MADSLKPLNKNEILRVAGQMEAIRKSLEKLVPLLYQEVKRSPQNILEYEKQYSTLLNALKEIRKLMKNDLGWFSPLDSLIAHAKDSLEQIEKRKVA